MDIKSDEELHSDDQEKNEKSDSEDLYSPDLTQDRKPHVRRRERSEYQKEYRKRQKMKKVETEDPVPVQRKQYSNYKRTTDKQYSLLTHEMVRFRIENRADKNSGTAIHWRSLTDKLNALGPPYRTMQQWKKVWIDFIGFHSKRNFKSVPKFTKTIKSGSNIGCDIFKVEEQEGDEVTCSENKLDISTEDTQFLPVLEASDQNSQSMHSTNSINYADKYTCPDRQSSPELTRETETYESYTYARTDSEKGTLQSSINQPSVSNDPAIPTLCPSTNKLLEQTLYNVQNQMENQTKLLEHLSNISSTMAGLMERQVTAVEKQTEAVRRQALATEHHTLVMNNFIDIIREKLPKTNSRTTTASSSNLTNRSS